MFLGDPGDDDELSDLQRTLYVTAAVALVLMSGLMSGLTLGLISLDTVELEVLRRSGTATEKRYAATIMPVVKNQHLLLVTLLLCNAACTEALPLFIDRLADPVTAVIVSITAVLMFGEVIPQAICSRYGLQVGAYSAWFVRALMLVCSPIAWPIGKLLDLMLGSEHSALFRRAQLKALVDVHSTTAGFGGTLSEQEISVIRGALDLTSKTASKSMTPLHKVFMLSSEDRLDERTMQAILLSGHSRIPIYRGSNRQDIIGLLLSKELVLLNPADHVPVSHLRIRDLPRLSADTPMYDMLKLFETGKSHMALLTQGHLSGGGTSSSAVQGGQSHTDSTSQAPGQQRTPDDQRRSKYGPAGTAQRGTKYGPLAPGGQEDDGNFRGSPRGRGLKGPGAQQQGQEAGEGQPVGIITIEDIIEELLGTEIIDEFDIYVDNLQATRVNTAELTGTLPPRLQRILNAGLFTPRVGRLGSPQLAGRQAGSLDLFGNTFAPRHQDTLAWQLQQQQHVHSPRPGQVTALPGPLAPSQPASNEQDGPFGIALVGTDSLHSIHSTPQQYQDTDQHAGDSPVTQPLLQSRQGQASST